MADVLKKVPVREQAPKVRATNFDEVCLGYNADEAMEEASRCINCKNAKCMQGCPVSINIPAFVHEVKEGNFEKAYQIISESSALPAICGRVCPQESQCEGKCIRGIKGEAISIGKLERFVADWARENGIRPAAPAEKNGKKVAVIGSGPSGLTCAGDLAKLGYDVTIFEALHEAGGVLVYGIPEFRLPKLDVVAKEVENVKALGVKIETNVIIGRSITIDELIGYEPQMEKEEIKKLYLRLSKDFSVLPFDDVLAECLETAKKYYSCYPLLFQLGTLLINHAAQASNSEQVTQIMEKALEWCHRVRTEADEPNLQKEALLMESFCLLQLQRPAEAIDILDPVEMQAGSPEPLLASAYRMTGNDQEAKKILQAGIYKEIMVLLDLFPSYLNLCLNDTEQFAEACERFYRIADIFQMKTLHPSILFGVYITIAQDWMALGNTEQALDVLMQYTELAVSDIYPLHLHGDKFFNLLDEWLEGELVLGSFPPRDETLIRHSITQALSENPAFLPLANNPRFQAMVDRLRANEEGK